MDMTSQFSTDSFSFQDIDEFALQPSLSPFNSDFLLPATPDFVNHDLVPDFEYHGNGIGIPGEFALGLHTPEQWAYTTMPNLPLHNSWPGSTSFTGDPFRSTMFTQPWSQPFSPYRANTIMENITNNPPLSSGLHQLPETFKVGDTIFHRNDLAVPVPGNDAHNYGSDSQNFGMGEEDQQEDPLAGMTPEILAAMLFALGDSQVPPEIANPIAWLRGANMSILEEELPEFVEWWQNHYSTNIECEDGCAEHSGQDEDMTAAGDNDGDDDGDQVGPSHAQMPSMHKIQIWSMEHHGVDAVDPEKEYSADPECGDGCAEHSGQDENMVVDDDSGNSAAANNDADLHDADGDQRFRLDVIDRSSAPTCRGKNSPRRGSTIRRSKRGKAALLALSPESRASGSIHATAKRRAREHKERRHDMHPNECAYSEWRKNNKAWAGFELREVIGHQEFKRLKHRVRWQCPHCVQTLSRDDALVRHVQMNHSSEPGLKIQVYDDGTPVLNRKRPTVDHWLYMVGNAPWPIVEYRTRVVEANHNGDLNH